jgi:glycerol-3-phosphate dehydrogenase subunit C
MKEGSTEAPTRHALAWREEAFYDEAALDAEMRRVFDICHGCRRCFNLCDSFPRLFDLIDASTSEEIEAVASSDFGAVVEACTLCDMCFMTKCPYVPPHPFNLDFPHLMLRYRAVEAKKGHGDARARALGETDRNGKLAQPVAALANLAASHNPITRPIMEWVAGVDAHADLPKFHSRTFTMAARQLPPTRNAAAPAAARKAVLFATCFVNYNRPVTGEAALAVLAKNGVETAVVYPGCCGMPSLEQGDLARVARQAENISAALKPWIDKGYDIVTLTASCGLMFKFEWPLILPENETVKALSAATFDIDEYVVDIAKKEGLAPGLAPLDGKVSVHLACHARAQNMGPKAAEMLKLVPSAEIEIIERCSGHGGTFGVLKGTHEIAMKVGAPVANTALRQAGAYVVSDCPLAGKHIVQMMHEKAGYGVAVPHEAQHPIELLAKSYGLCQPE